MNIWTTEQGEKLSAVISNLAKERHTQQKTQHKKPFKKSPMKMFDVNLAKFINLYTDGKIGAIVEYADLFDTRVKSNNAELFRAFSEELEGKPIFQNVPKVQMIIFFKF